MRMMAFRGLCWVYAYTLNPNLYTTKCVSGLTKRSLKQNGMGRGPEPPGPLQGETGYRSWYAEGLEEP